MRKQSEDIDMQNCAVEFKNTGVTKVSAALDKAQCDLIANYVRLKALSKVKIRSGQDPLSGIHREYADPLFETLMEQLRPQVEAATGLSLWSTLSFCYHYTHGNVLNPHTDRNSCEIVAGLCIGADPQFVANKQSWPLHLKDSPPIDINFGDMLIFRGSDIEHWRERFTGVWFVSAILGYVDQNGPHAYLKYDQRKALGHKHIGMTRWYMGVLKQKLRSTLLQR